jgi:hypothetical protein
MTTSQDIFLQRTGILMRWLKRCNQTMLAWAASLTWVRLTVLGLIVLIASSWIADTLNLRHGQTSISIDINTDGEVAPPPVVAASKDCTQAPVPIDDHKYLLICDRTLGAAADDPAKAASSPPVPAKSAPAKHVHKRTETVPRHTLGGYIGDLVSAAMVAFFAYLVAAKIIVRKSAESEALVRAATSQAEHEALERQLVQARLKLLQAQVEPHFLFNTLAAVDYLIETDPPRASVMQKQLITYLRGALPQMREDSSTLGREVGLVHAYLELLKMRIEDRLEFSLEVPDALSSVVFPPMVLQSIVENAIKHGIEPKPEGGKITVRAQKMGDSLWVDILDTGVGLPEGNIFGTSTNGTGLGLDNIRKRLALLYPGASRIELRSEPAGGTSVRLIIPCQTAPIHASHATDH